MLNYERPNHSIYPSSANNEEEPCCFCGAMSSEETLREKLGPVYGPIRVKGHKIFVHELCAIWTPEVYLDDKNKF